eukprot:TRINITY_DN45618_c0_g1_i4.p1 TRINITY_DN45618_c0_g1~~TRINITY_DN45618_c0_g1_i4.p1  ORF type:complete len:254 (-),score=51.45 TRINITY_DN45618_c0_g1_i4:181-942(-)
MSDFESNVELVVPFTHLNARHPLRVDKHSPSPPTLAQIALINQNAVGNLWRGHAGVLSLMETSSQLVRFQEFQFDPSFYTTVLESGKLTISTIIVSVGKSSWSILGRFINAHRVQVGTVLTTNVSVEHGRPSVIPADNKLRRDMANPEVYKKYLKDTPKFVFHLQLDYSLSDGRLHFVYPLQIRSSDQDLYLHVNQSVLFAYAMDALDAALIAHPKLVGLSGSFHFAKGSLSPHSLAASVCAIRRATQGWRLS